ALPTSCFDTHDARGQRPKFKMLELDNICSTTITASGVASENLSAVLCLGRVSTGTRVSRRAV
ncbi:MAG: hypothetical protein P8Y36_09770, partial [Alphaproteobacteria bacterium]